MTLALDGQWSTSYPGKEFRYPLCKRLGGPQSSFGCFGEEKNLFLLLRFEIWTVRAVAWSLYRLSYRDSSVCTYDEERNYSLDDDGSLFGYGVVLPVKWLVLLPRNLLLLFSGEKNLPDYTVSYILISSNEMQQYAGVYLLQNYSTCFGCLSHPSSGVHETVTAASGTSHITYQSNELLPVWSN